MPVFCPQCGSQNRDDARFCTRWATPLKPTAGGQPATPYGPQPGQPPPYQPGMPVQSTYQVPAYQPSYADQSAYSALAVGSYAGIGSRFGALFIDGAIGAVIQLPGHIIFGATSESGEIGVAALGGLVALIFFLAAVAFFFYNVYLLGRDGATIGKKVLKLRVLDQTGRPLGFGRALLRELCKFISALPCYLGFLWAIWDAEKQAWHDKIMSTHVYDA